MGIMNTYGTFVGLAIEGESTNSPYRDGATGALSSQGVTSTAGLVYLPLSGQETMMSNPNFVELPMPEGQNLVGSKYQSIAVRVEGSVTVTVPPGLMSTLQAWLFTRSWGPSTAPQCPSATLWIAVGNRCKRFVGCKVASADFQVAKGQPLTIALNLMGYGEESVTAPTFTAPTWWHHAVYAGDSISINQGVDTGSLTASYDLDSLRWTVNNMIDDDPHRLWSSNYPRRMYNRARETTGAFDGDYFGDADYARFLSGATTAIQAIFSKTIPSAGTFTSTHTWPRARYNAHSGTNAAGQKDIILKQAVDWKAMGGRIGVDATQDEYTWA